MVNRLCSIKSCNRKHKGLGYCDFHYYRFKTYGDPLYEPFYETHQECKIYGCNLKVLAKKLCSKHYWSKYRHGEAQPRGRNYHDINERLRLNTQEVGDCLIWTGYKTNDGYARVTIKGKSKLLHRYLWEKYNHSVPDGHSIDHKCHNRDCVEIEHLRLAKIGQNGANRAGPIEGSESGARNVYPYYGNWLVRVIKEGKYHRFGVYETVEEAAIVADNARKELFGEFAGKG